MKAYKNAMEKDILGTDDASLAELAGFPVTMFEGSSRNIKLTSADDIILGEFFIGLSKTEF
jgi:2-C-methyl-D-erythritol 4-phosphate cytidylyltransferase